jgi:hypothetical protein
VSLLDACGTDSEKADGRAKTRSDESKTAPEKVRMMEECPENRTKSGF